jgi:phosphatidylserine/phosphatidylglycerophosphate/cardiolipin synthase-like enzyme
VNFRRTFLITFLTLGLLTVAVAFGIWRVAQTIPEHVIDVHRPGNTPTIGAVHFGGPDKPKGVLSDMLLARIDAVPPGGSILWATYYFRDMDLARALIRASDRGVHVTLCFDGDPRLDNANAAAIALLRNHGLHGGLVVREALPDPFDVLQGKLHSKIYIFSAPYPVAFVGSFNPSGDENTDKATLEEIGDQDRGHNLLVELISPGLVQTLADHVREIARDGGSVDRFAASDNRIFQDGDTRLYFYPRLRPYIVENAVDNLERGDRMWAAISHLKAGMVDRIANAAKRGVVIDMVVHATERRVPSSAVRELETAGVSIRRYRDPQGLPMHAKFVVMQTHGQLVSWFGSLNYNRNSRWLNDELLVRTTNAPFAHALLDRYAFIEREIDANEHRR